MCDLFIQSELIQSGQGTLKLETNGKVHLFSSMKYLTLTLATNHWYDKMHMPISRYRNIAAKDSEGEECRI
jgi:hypothetical protein